MERDFYHALIRRALEADGWQITHDPLALKYGEETNLYVDLGAESPLAAEKEGRKIAVEVKSFLNPSPMSELERALGQFSLYRFLISRQYPGRMLYLAIPISKYDRHFDTSEGRELITELNIKFILYDTETEEIKKWIE